MSTSNKCECCGYTPRLGLIHTDDYYICYACKSDVGRFIHEMMALLSINNIKIV